MKPITLNTQKVNNILNDGKIQIIKNIKNVDIYKAKSACLLEIDCPYGKIGDVLWVRETFSYAPLDEESKVNYPKLCVYIYKACKAKWICIKWNRSNDMPKKACRLFLTITDIKIKCQNDKFVWVINFEKINFLNNKTWIKD